MLPASILDITSRFTGILLVVAMLLTAIGIAKELFLAAVALLFAGLLADFLAQIPRVAALLGLFGGLGRQGHQQSATGQQG